jgi:hypothetical protein
MKPICKPDGVSATQVCNLLMPSRSWDDGALSENFVHMDAVAIKRFPLARFGEDFWTWTKEKHVMYLVRSAYRMLADEVHQIEDFSQNMPSCSSAINSWLWKKLWQSKVPPKVRVFWWRVSNDFFRLMGTTPLPL